MDATLPNCSELLPALRGTLAGGLAAFRSARDCEWRSNIEDDISNNRKRAQANAR